MDARSLDLINVQLTCYFKIQDLLGDSGDFVYTSVALNNVAPSEQLARVLTDESTCTGFVDFMRKRTAEDLHVPIDCITPITYEQYVENTEDDDDEDY